MRLVRIAIILTALFWLIVLTQHAFWLRHALQPRFTQDPRIGSFASRYVVTSSGTLLLFVAAAAVLAFFVVRSRRAWAAAALCVLFAFAFWHYFVAGWPLFFRPPFGDGSLHAAVVGYFRFHTAGLWLHAAKLCLLLSCFTLWAAVSYHISHDGHEQI